MLFGYSDAGMHTVTLLNYSHEARFVPHCEGEPASVTGDVKGCPLPAVKKSGGGLAQCNPPGRVPDGYVIRLAQISREKPPVPRKGQVPQRPLETQTIHLSPSS